MMGRIFRHALIRNLRLAKSLRETVKKSYGSTPCEQYGVPEGTEFALHTTSGGRVAIIARPSRDNPYYVIKYGPWDGAILRVLPEKLVFD